MLCNWWKQFRLRNVAWKWADALPDSDPRKALLYVKYLEGADVVKTARSLGCDI